MRKVLFSCLCILIATGTNSIIAAPRLISPQASVATSIDSQASLIKQLQVLRKNSQLDQAKQLAIKHLQNYPNDVDIMLILGLIYYQEKNYTEAQNYLQNVLLKVPTYTDAKMGLVRVYLAQGKQKEAQGLLATFAKETPRLPELIQLEQAVNNAQIIVQKKSLSLAGKATETNVALNQTATSSSILKQIQTLRKKAQPDKAKNLAINYLKKNPNDVDVVLLLGLIYYQQKNYAKASEYLHCVLVKVPNYLDAKLGIIRIAIAQGHYKQATSLINQALKQSPNNVELKKLKVQNLNAQKALQEKQTLAGKEKSEYTILSDLFKQRKYLLILARAEVYLANNPNDADVQLIVGKVYVQLKNYLLAKEIFLCILASYPKYTDARRELINIELICGRDLTALCMVEEGLRIQPNNPELLVKKANVFFAQHKHAQAAALAKKVVSTSPEITSAKELLQNVKEITPYYTYGVNEVGIASRNDYVADLRSIWDYSSLYYSRDTTLGRFTTKVNYASRFGKQAPQLELNFSPIMNQYIYFDLMGTYANEPVLFPRHTVGAEGYLVKGFPVELSLGGTHSYIVKSTYYSKFTTSISKSYKNYWISFRPNVYIPARGAKSTLFTATLRRYFKTTDCYLNLMLGAGRSPDLSDLLTLDFITIKNNFVILGAEFPIFNHHIIVDVDTSYQRWKYPSGLVRNLYGGNIGLKYRF